MVFMHTERADSKYIGLSQISLLFTDFYLPFTLLTLLRQAYPPPAGFLLLFDCPEGIRTVKSKATVGIASVALLKECLPHGVHVFNSLRLCLNDEADFEDNVNAYPSKALSHSFIFMLCFGIRKHDESFKTFDPLGSSCRNTGQRGRQRSKALHLEESHRTLPDLLAASAKCRQQLSGLFP